MAEVVQYINSDPKSKINQILLIVRTNLSFESS